MNLILIPSFLIPITAVVKPTIPRDLKLLRDKNQS